METEGYRSSPFNFVEAVASSSGTVRDVHIADVTLREGEQGCDAAFRPEEKVEVAALLEAAGVHQIQVGFPRPDAATVRLIKAAGLKVPVELLCVGFTPAWQTDVDAALDAGADVVQILMRSSDRQLAAIGLSRDQALERVTASIDYARTQGARAIAFCPSFATQADLAFLKEICRAAVVAGAARVVVTDSLGVARPAAMRFLVQEVKAATGVAVEVHCHNDFGLGIACTLAGLEGGATWADVTVNGTGERCGNAALEELVLALCCLYGVDPGVKTERLYDLSRTVSRLLGLPIPDNKPVVGDGAFVQKLDIHVMVAAKQPELFEPYDPALVGNGRSLRLGKGSGPAAVRAKLEQLGLAAGDDEVRRLVAWVNAAAERTKRFVSDDAFRAAAEAGVSLNATPM